MEEAEETGPMKMDGGKTREVALPFSRLSISINYRDVMGTLCIEKCAWTLASCRSNAVQLLEQKR